MIEFNAHNTSIQVPKIYCVCKRKGWMHIVMEKVKGESIVHGWTVGHHD